MERQQESKKKYSYRIQPGDRLRDRYVIRRVLGEGGFGITYQGYDEVLANDVAIKEYYPEGLVRRNVYTQGDCLVYPYDGMDRDVYDKGLHNFLMEARALAGFGQLEGIVSVRDFFEANQTAYIVMEYLEGMSVKQYVRRYGPIPWQEALEKLRRILTAVNALHEHDMIHRDLSSDNIMVMPDGQLKLIDFGSARHLESSESTQTMTVMFKRGYAAEEQYRSKGKQGPWTDVYGISATLYYMLTGVAPDESVERTIHDQVRPLEECKAQEIPQQISRAVEAGMRVYAKDRLQDMGQLWQSLYGEPMPQPDERLARHEESVTGDTAPDGWDDAGQESEMTSAKTDTDTAKRRTKSELTFTALQRRLDREIRSQARKRQTQRRRRWLLPLCVLLASCLCLGAVWYGLERVGRPGDGGDDHQTVTTQGPRETLPVTTPQPSQTPESVPSATPQRIAVPQVKGLSLKKARKKLKRISPNQVIITYAYDEQIPKGKVISQKPAAGKMVPEGRSVRLRISKGARPAAVNTPQPVSTPAPRHTSPAKGRDDDIDGTLDGIF